MFLFSWRSGLPRWLQPFRQTTASRRGAQRRQHARRPLLEPLEDRCLLASSPIAVPGATQAFLKVDGAPGESTDAIHPRWIDIESFSFGASNASAATSTAPDKASANGQDLNVVMRVNTASPILLNDAVIRRPVAKVELAVRMTGTGRDFLTYTLRDVHVSALQVRDVGDTVPVEEVSFAYGILDETYNSILPDGSLGAHTDSGDISFAYLNSAGEVQYRRLAQSPGDSLLESTPAFDTGATNVFLRADGIAGDPKDVTHHTGWLAVNSFDWGVSNPALAANGASLQDFQVVMPINAASPVWLKTLGTVSKTAALAVQRNNGQAAGDFLTYTMANLRVTSYQVQALGGAVPMEQLSFTFDSLDEVYRPTQGDGTLGGPTDSTVLGFQGHGIAATPGTSLLTATPALFPGATQVFLKVPNVPGDATDQKHLGQITVQSFSWGDGLQVVNGVYAASTSPQELHVLLPVSKASPLLLADAAGGPLLTEVDLAVAISIAGQSQDVVTYVLKNVRASSYQDRSLGAAVPSEEVSFSLGLPAGVIVAAGTKSTFNESIMLGENGKVSSGDVDFSRSPLAATPEDGLLPTSAPNQGSMFLQVDGIPGDATDMHSGEIAVASFGWGVSGAWTAGGGGLQDFHVVMPIDSAAPPLLGKAVAARELGTVVVADRLAGTAAPQPDTVSYTLMHPLITSYQIQDFGNGLPVAEMTLQFTDITVNDVPFDARGNAQQSVSREVDFSGSSLKRTAGASLMAMTPTIAPGNTGIFLNVPSAPGDSTKQQHPRQIEVQSFSWGVSNSGRAVARIGKPAPVITMQDFHFVMPAGSASVPLMAASANATGQDGVVASLDMVNANAQAVGELTLALGHSLVSSYQIRDLGQSIPTEEATFSCTELTETYQPTGGFAASLYFHAIDPSRRAGTAVNLTPAAGPSLLATLPALLSTRTSNLFLRIPNVDGEATAQHHAKEIQIVAFGWGARTSSDVKGLTSTLQSFDVVLDVSTASPLLFQKGAVGKDLGSLVLTVARASSQPLPDFLVSALEGQVGAQLVQIDSYQVRDIGGIRPLEEVSFRFGTVDDVLLQLNAQGAISARFQDDADFNDGRRLTWTTPASLLDRLAIPFVIIGGGGELGPQTALTTILTAGPDLAATALSATATEPTLPAGSTAATQSETQAPAMAKYNMHAAPPTAARQPVAPGRSRWLSWPWSTTERQGGIAR